MDDERYVGTLRSILTKKAEALDYAESMAPHFEQARAAAGGPLSRGAYATLFESEGLLTSNRKPRWYTTQITNLMETDTQAIAKRDDAVADFEYHYTYFRGPTYRRKRAVSDQDWIKHRNEYVSGLDAVIDRAKVIASRIRGSD